MWTEEKIDEAVDAFIEREGRLPKAKDFRVKYGMLDIFTISSKTKPTSVLN